MKRQLVERELTEEGPRRALNTAKRRRSVTVNVAESPLGWLHSRGHLDDRLFDAGEQLRADFERAQLAPSITMRWDPVRIKGGPDAGLSPTERQVAARERFDGAVEAAGKGLAKFSGALCVRVRRCRSPKRRCIGLHGAGNWY